MRAHRRGIPGALLMALLAAVLLAGCGSKGNAPALGQPAAATLSGTGGQASYSASLTPVVALHASVFYKGAAVPVTGAQTPAQLRRGSCFGPFVADLTDGNTPETKTGIPSPGATPETAPSAPVATAPDPRGGMDVDVAPDASLFVIVLARANDPAASVVACGQPLSGRRQYFDLYPPTNNDIATGNALFDPIVASRVAITRLAAGAGAAGSVPSAWAVRQGSCTGSVLASGKISSGDATPYGGTVFAPLAPEQWWVTLTLAGGAVLCGQAKTAS
jgi:hypothetical protein